MDQVYKALSPAVEMVSNMISPVKAKSFTFQRDGIVEAIGNRNATSLSAINRESGKKSVELKGYRGVALDDANAHPTAKKIFDMTDAVDQSEINVVLIALKSNIKYLECKKNARFALASEISLAAKNVREQRKDADSENYVKTILNTDTAPARKKKRGAHEMSNARSILGDVTNANYFANAPSPTSASASRDGDYDLD